MDPEPSSEKTGKTPPTKRKKLRGYRSRCGACAGCATPDCGTCKECSRKRKYGGDGSSKQACLQRKCIMPQPSKASRPGSNKEPNQPSISPPKAAKSKKTKKAKTDTPAPKQTKVADGDKNKKLKPSPAAKRKAATTPKQSTITATSSTSATSSNSNNIATPNRAAAKSNTNSGNRRKRASPAYLDTSTYQPQHLSSRCAPTVPTPPPVNRRLRDGLDPADFRPPSLLEPPKPLSQRQRLLQKLYGAKKQTPGSKESNTDPGTIYGIPIPTNIPEGVCAGCLGREHRYFDYPDHKITAQQRAESTVILCDGCPREYHLGCCIPQIREVPEGIYLCFDCCPKGSSKYLEDYFTAMEESKAQLNDYETIQEVTMIQDLEDVRKEHEPNRDDQTPTRFHWPVSELVHIHREEPESLVGKAIRMHSPLENSYHNGRILQVEPIEGGEDTHCLVRFPAGSDGRKQTVTVWMDLEDHSVAVAVRTIWAKFDSFVYNRRKRGSLSKSRPGELHFLNIATFDNDSDQNGEEDSDGMDMDETSAESIDHDIAERSHHLLNWAPGKIWFRTAREIVPVLYLCKEGIGHVQYRREELHGKNQTSKTQPGNGKSGKPQRSGRRKSPNPKSPKGFSVMKRDNIGTAAYEHLPWALTETFGKRIYRLLDYKTEIRDTPPTDFFDASVREHLTNTLRWDGLQYLCGLLHAEIMEQKRVRDWTDLPLHQTFHPKALSSRDELTLGPLEFQPDTDMTSGGIRILHNHVQSEELESDDEDTKIKTDVGGEATKQTGSKKKKSSDADVPPSKYVTKLLSCPGFSQGLDRQYMMEIMSGRYDVAPSRDLAMTLDCTSIEDVCNIVQSLGSDSEGDDDNDIIRDDLVEEFYEDDDGDDSTQEEVVEDGDEDGNEDAIIQKEVVEDAIVHEEVVEQGDQDAIIQAKVEENGGEDGDKDAIVQEVVVDDGNVDAVIHEENTEDDDDISQEESIEDDDDSSSKYEEATENEIGDSQQARISESAEAYDEGLSEDSDKFLIDARSTATINEE